MARVVKSTPQFTGPLNQMSITSVNSDITLNDMAEVWLISGETTLTLPLASTLPKYRFQIKRIGTDQITIATSGSDLLDGETSLIVDTQYTSITVVSDGVSKWHII